MTFSLQGKNTNVSGRAIGYALLLNLFIFGAHAQEMKKDSLDGWNIDYGNKGFELRSNSNEYLLQIQSRLQFRIATPSDQNPLNLDDFDNESNSVFKINRARLKVGGHAYKPWLKFYWEYELGQSNLLDYRIMIEKWEWLNLKVGQWKVEFSRERRISSGKQQLVDRSILNRNFTVDRQQGIELYGRLRQHGSLDFSYWAGVFTGTGRSTQENDDGHLMYFGRLQWNVLGEDLGFNSSDLEIHKDPEAIIALAGVTNRSPFTRFSSAGGGFLTDFEKEENGQYRVNQVNLESAFVYQGFSAQGEFHRKEIINKLEDNRKTTLGGYYVNAGYLAHQSFLWWPKALEIAARYAHFRPDMEESMAFEEKTLGFNWFFHGHNNKLSVEISQFDLETDSGAMDDEFRFRLQWDISF
ncbi:porin [Flavimarina sp. Hel_I_48]|uniref:porin n=1 Tax=Flavimarina sp. Hel_I_48 TaxID=1392488 RepID=UPI000692608D|nr:porin [Flavimarina sp. Hel_I_48]